MKNYLTDTIKLIANDRLVAILLGLFILTCLVYCIYVGLSLRPSDLQVAVHYTAFGETNFYRQKWYYLLSFIAFAVVMAVVHTALTVKLYAQERRQIAILFILISLLMAVIMWLITRSVLNIAFL